MLPENQVSKSVSWNSVSMSASALHGPALVSQSQLFAVLGLGPSLSGFLFFLNLFESEPRFRSALTVLRRPPESGREPDTVLRWSARAYC